MNNREKAKTLIVIVVLYVATVTIFSDSAKAETVKESDLIMVDQQSRVLYLEDMKCVVSEKLYKKALPAANGKPLQRWRVIEGRCVSYEPIKENQWILNF